MKNCKKGATKNDIVYTPDDLAKSIVEYFNPTGSILEPCKGDGAFLKYLPNADWCEIQEGVDFMDCNKMYDWIITNPPWSIFRPFLRKSCEVSDNVVFLVPVVHYFGKARLRELSETNHYIKEIIVVKTPKTFPQMGFALGVVHTQRFYKGDCKISTWF